MSPFDKILDKTDVQLILSESAHFVAALEKNPLKFGHVIIISKVAVDDLFDISDEALSTALVFAKPISKAIRKVFQCKKVGVAVIGLIARHAHLHLVPIESADDLNFTRTKLSPSFEELASVAEKIRFALAKSETP